MQWVIKKNNVNVCNFLCENKRNGNENFSSRVRFILIVIVTTCKLLTTPFPLLVKAFLVSSVTLLSFLFVVRGIVHGDFSLYSQQFLPFSSLYLSHVVTSSRTIFIFVKIYSH